MLLKKGLNGKILGVLSERFPLQVNEIRTLMIERYQVKNSTQAIHLALNSLIEGGVVAKEGHQYKINPSFIINLDKEVRTLKKAYFSKKVPLFRVPKNGKIAIKASSLLEQDDYWNSIIREKLAEYPPVSQIYVQKIPHAWFALSNIGEEISITTTILESFQGFYTLINNDTILDQWIGRFYAMPKSLYKTQHIADPQEYNYQVAILGDYILESRYPRELAIRMNAMFESTRKLSQLYIQELIAIVGAQSDLTITLSRNKNRAEKLRGCILAAFNG